MRTISTVITSTAMLVALAVPALAESAAHMPRESDRTVVYTYNPSAARESQMPASASALNQHVYHGGPKLNN